MDATGPRDGFVVNRGIHRADDCDGTVDEGTAAYDDDGDGYTENGGDCDDANADIYPASGC